MAVGDSIQLKAAQELYNRGWRFNTSLQLWVARLPRWFSVTRFDYNGASKPHDLLKIQSLIALVEILSVKKNPLQDLLSSVNAVISINERH